MKKALPNTKVTVKLRRSNYKEEWYLTIESYPVYKRGSKRASRVVESINRTISTPVWDKSSIAQSGMKDVPISLLLGLRINYNAPIATMVCSFTRQDSHRTKL